MHPMKDNKKLFDKNANLIKAVNLQIYRFLTNSNMKTRDYSVLQIE